MTWVKIDDGMPNHPRMLGLSDGALATWVRGLCYSSAYLTDGMLPKAARSHLGRPKSVEELVSRGVWTETLSGWYIVGYEDHQRTKADVDADRKANVERQKRKRDRERGAPQLPGVTALSRRDTPVSHALVTGRESEEIQLRGETDSHCPEIAFTGSAPQAVDNPDLALAEIRSIRKAMP